MSATLPSSDQASAEGLEPESSKSGRKARHLKSSCAECHRLKLKCDKKIPCGSCVRRGCDSICPSGTLRSIGRGKRSVMSDVPELTSIISEMGERIRQLEQAVASTHDGARSSHHPLLSQPHRQPAPSTPAQNADALGSFSVNVAGDAVYFGPTAGTEALLSIEGAAGSHSHGLERLSFTAVTESFPFSSVDAPSWDADQALEQLYLYLPQETRAWALCETYFKNGCWTAMPLMQAEAVELLTQVYRQRDCAVNNQQMAIVYLVFGLGALVDLDLPPYSPEADHYFDLACAAMSVKSLFENSTVLTVQALTMLASYFAHGGRRFTMDGAWSMISLASSISQALGLHRESFGSKLPPKLAYRCRALFWETYSVETIYGLSVGRPTGTFLSSISCPMPPDEDDVLDPFVKINRGYRQARWRYTSEITAPIMETFLTTAKPSYETVLELDQRIRRYMLSTPFESFPVPENDVHAFIQRNLIPLFAKIMLMYIHSGSFVEAMRDNPANPLSSSYAASFLAAYRNASEIIKSDVRNLTKYPSLFTRWWAIWKSLFNAAIIVGTIATRYPKSKMAPHAIVELFTAVDLIEKGAMSSGRAQSGLAILQRLRDKAIAVYSQSSGHSLTPPPPTADSQTEEELEIFAGYTRVVANKVLAHGLRDQRQVSTSTSLQLSPGLGPHESNSSHSSASLRWQQLDHDYYKSDDAAMQLQRDFDPCIVQYFDSAAPSPFADLDATPLARPQGMPSYADAGFFFTTTYPPSSLVAAISTAAAGVSVGDQSTAGFQYATVPSAGVAQEMQWAEFLQSL
ncbi:hypothetical protein GGX14DRAFT_445819 [Mycena pura]|uniref:Zn(2)-C6 fungal-type domain-containing protein n=1 Tax=Mycena pura TaxID=153505 RepID=A0AAD6YET2_9AGAR|nr:hypothetical protein GGX14DRAFT_445819 [Mycena pura]